jgi:hypothetical protein
MFKEERRVLEPELILIEEVNMNSEHLYRPWESGMSEQVTSGNYKTVDQGMSCRRSSNNRIDRRRAVEFAGSWEYYYRYSGYITTDCTMYAATEINRP